jgi:hypothetical protein
MAEPDGDITTDDGPEDVSDGAFEVALDQFHAICQAQQEERALCLQDRRFVSIAGAQWEGDWAQQFSNSIMVEVNKTAQGTEKIYADYRANRMLVDFRAETDSAADEQTAETLNGLFMADVYRSKGKQAFDGAFEEAVAGGMGAWRLCNEYVDEYDPDDDTQRIGFKWIPDADQSVFWDMDARLYDKSDAKFCHVISAMSPQAFKDAYDDDPASWPQDILKPYYDWYTPDVVRIAEYYRVIETTKTRLSFEHVMTGETRKEWLDDLEPGERQDLKTQGWRQTGQKRVKRREVEKLTFSAAGEIAPRQIIAGDQIPVVPVYGKRWFIDNMERVRGHVRLAKDPQRIYNAQISKLTETASITPIERPIFTAEQIAGHETQWAEASINRYPYSVINSIIDPTSGQAIPTGPVGTVTPPQLPPVLGALIQITANDVAQLTTNEDNADEVRSNVSAEAMDMAATRTDAKTFTYMDNMRQSMQRCGEIYLSMAKEVYSEAGRVVPTMDEEGQQGNATLMEPSMDDKGRMFLANDFNSVKLNVIADVTEATSTRRDKTVRTMIASAETTAPFDPQAAAAMIGIAIMNMDGEGISDFKDWTRSRLVQQGVIKPTEQEKEQMAQAAAQQGQQPDPQAMVLQAQVQKEQAQTEKAKAQTEQTKAATVKYLTEARATHQDAEHQRAQAASDAAKSGLEAAQKDQQHRVSMLEKVGKFFATMSAKAGQ